MNMTSKVSGRKIYARSKKEIALHWFNAACWLVLTVSGVGIIRGDLRFMPQGFADWMQNLVGGQFTLIIGHSLLGMTWAGILLWFTAKNWNTVVLPFLKTVLSLTPASIMTNMRSMVVMIANLFGFLKNVELPPSGRYNGAQRLLGTMIMVSGVLVAITGTVMFVMFIFTQLMVPGLIFRWALVAHGFFVGLVWIGLVAHVYYAMIEAPQSLEGMKSGYLDADYVKHHSPGWYAELKEQGKV